MRTDTSKGQAELSAARRLSNKALAAAFIFSVFVNLLMLTGPLYMLQVYDRVLASRSEPTLLALSLLAAFMFLMMGILDHTRSRVMARVGARLQDALDARVLRASFRALTVVPNDTAALAAQRDLESIQRLWASPVLIALFDIPWTPLFLAAIFVFHPWLGWASVAGMVVLVIITIWNQRATEGPLARANMATMTAERHSDNLKAESELIQALGMTGAAFNRWQKSRGAALSEGLVAADTAGVFGSVSKTFRLFLQSAMLGLGALLVLRGQMSPGAMIAGSILLGRALQPIEQAVSQWALVTRARQGHARLVDLLSRVPVEPQRTALPRPKAVLDVQTLSVVPPGETQAILRGVSLHLEPGQALGVIGPSGSGKSTLARALIGVWRPAAGKIRLDGATLDQYDADVLGSYIGYLPQRVTLFDGTIADNIARLQSNADPVKIVDAAKKAAAHDMILRLPEGYDTRVSTVGGRLSGGQIQRIGLARALYGDPLIIVLDEPNSNLDNDGSVALNAAIRSAKAAGCAVLIMAHRPAAIQECELLMVMEDGARRAYGPRDQVLKEMVKNASEIQRSATPGGVV